MWRLMNVICYVNRIKDQKTHYHLNRYSKSTGQNPTSIHDKNIQQTENWTKHLQPDKVVYGKPTANTKWWETECFPLKPGKRQKYLLLPLLSNILPVILVSAIRQEEYKEFSLKKKG